MIFLLNRQINIARRAQYRDSPAVYEPRESRFENLRIKHFLENLRIKHFFAIENLKVSFVYIAMIATLAVSCSRSLSALTQEALVP